MYTQDQLQRLIASAEAAITKPVERYGIGVYVDTDPDWIGSDIYISNADAEGIAIFREFAARMAAHYETLTTTP